MRTLSAEWHRHTETPWDFLLLLWPSDSFCGKLNVYCFNNIWENSHWKIKNAVTSTVRKLVMATVPANVYLLLLFFCFLLFFFLMWNVKYLLFKRSLLKCILFVFRLKDKGEDRWRHSFPGGHVAIIWTSSHCHAALLLSKRRIHTSLMASFWIPSYIIILYAIYIYMLKCSIYIVHLFFNWQGGAAFELE